MKVFIVSWVQDLTIHSRAYTRKEDAEMLVEKCKNNRRRYSLLEEVIDREILTKDKCGDEYKDFIESIDTVSIQDWQNKCIKLRNKDIRG